MDLMSDPVTSLPSPVWGYGYPFWGLFPWPTSGYSGASLWWQCLIFDVSHPPLIDRTLGMKTVRIFSDRIRDRIRLERFWSVRIRVRIFNIRYCIRIWILKSCIYDIDIQSYLIRHGWYYSYSNPNPTRNMKTNMISVISVRIWSIFMPTVHTMMGIRCNRGGSR